MVSLVVPFYNEEERIHLFIDGLKLYTNPHQLISEIILVNDGSTDNTLDILYTIREQFPSYNIKVINIEPNQGKGNAIKTGILEASQKWVLCNDADLSYSMNQLDEWYDQKWLNLDQSDGVYFGSRELGKKNNEMKLFLHRKIIGRAYFILINLITKIEVHDTQCGFKLYHTATAKKIFSEVEEKRFAFDVEVHYLLKKYKIDIYLLPVKCIDVEGSKVNLVKDSWQMFKALFRIKRRHK